MNKIARLAAIGALALSPALSAGSAHAVSANFTEAAIQKINWDGFQTCKAQGDTGYTAVARGIHSAGGGGTFRGGFNAFQIRTCFETAAKCENFLNRIHHKVANIENFHYIGCKARG